MPTLIYVTCVVHPTNMQVGLSHVDSQPIRRLADRLHSGDITGHALLHVLCESTCLRSALDRPCLTMPAKALSALTSRLGVEFLPPHAVPDLTATPAVPTGDVPDVGLACPPQAFSLVSLNPEGDAGNRRLWETTMAVGHPL